MKPTSNQPPALASKRGGDKRGFTQTLKSGEAGAFQRTPHRQPAEGSAAAMRRENQKRRGVQGAGADERPLPPAWGAEHRSPVKGWQTAPAGAASAYMRGKWEEWKAQPGGRQFSDETREALSKGQKRRRALEALLRDRAGKRVRLDEDAERQPDWKLTVKQLSKRGISVERYGPKNKLYMRIPSRKEGGVAKLHNAHSRIMDSLDDRQGHDATSQLISGIAARACV